VRTSLIVLTLILLAISFSLYGQGGHFNLSG
jgi:phospholipid/cholesterol/gamma-HCH transport system permease protein